MFYHYYIRFLIILILKLELYYFFQFINLTFLLFLHLIKQFLNLTYLLFISEYLFYYLILYFNFPLIKKINICYRFFFINFLYYLNLIVIVNLIRIYFYFLNLIDINNFVVYFHHFFKFKLIIKVNLFIHINQILFFKILILSLKFQIHYLIFILKSFYFSYH
jgi:hypothetical protein